MASGQQRTGNVATSVDTPDTGTTGGGLATGATVSSGSPAVFERGDRTGSRPANVEYGNPYDPSIPPWSVYEDPVADAHKVQERQYKHYEKLAEEAKGDEYVFKGHKDPYEGTETLLTEAGRVSIGGTIKLTDELKKQLEGRGFKFSKTDE